MLTLVRLIGMIIAIMGFIFLLSPKLLKKSIAYWGKGKRLYIGAILRLLIGAVLLLIAPQCRLVEVIIIIGILTLIGGFLIFILGLERMKSMLNWWDKRPPLTLRFLGLATLIFGALILYSA